MTTMTRGSATYGTAMRPGQGRPGQGRSGQSRSDQGWPGQGRPSREWPGQGRPGQGRSGQGRPGQGRPAGQRPAVEEKPRRRGAAFLTVVAVASVAVTASACGLAVLHHERALRASATGDAVVAGISTLAGSQAFASALSAPKGGTSP